MYLEYEVHINMRNRQKYAPPLQFCWWCYRASPLQVGMGLTRMAATPCLLRPFYSGTLCGLGYGVWFSPSTGRRSGLYVHPIRVAPVPTRSEPLVSNPVYLVISLVNTWYQKLYRFQVNSKGSKRSHETLCRREAARRRDERNVWHEYLWREIPG